MGVCVVMKVCEIETLSLLVQMSGRIYINIFSFFLHFPRNNNRGALVYAIKIWQIEREKSHFIERWWHSPPFFFQHKQNQMAWNLEILLRSSQYFIDFDPNQIIVREQKTYLHKNGNVYKEFDLGCAVQESTFEFWV